MTVLRLEGRVVGPWVEELARACRNSRRSGPRLRLEMAGISFLAPEAVRLVKRLIRQGVQVSHCTSFVREQLDGECSHD